MQSRDAITINSDMLSPDEWEIFFFFPETADEKKKKKKDANKLISFDMHNTHI